MSYTNQLIGLARRLEQPLSLERSDESNKYKVTINLVGYKDQYLRQSIFGLGFTIEDACYDYIRKSRGGKLVHYLTDQEVDVI